MLLPALGAATVATAAALTRVPPLALAALSAAVLLLLLDHRRVNLGARAAAHFLFWSCAYGLVRSLTIRELAEAKLGGAPYRLSSPLVTLWGVPLQELLGWTAALGLAAYCADRLLRRLGQSTDPYRTSLLAGLGMALVCLAVESAAVTGGWWTWSLAHARDGLLVFPKIALLDWGFVAIDFLLPFELWRRRAPLWPRLLSLLAFPVHLFGHAFPAKLQGPLPLSLFDLVHVGLVAALVAAAAASREKSPWPGLEEEKQRLQPLFAALILLGTTAAQLMLAKAPGLLWTGLPLLAALLLATFGRREQEPRRKPLERRQAVWLFAAVLVAGMALLMPAAYRGRELERLVRQAAAQLTANEAAAAKVNLEAALELRPNHAEVLWLLGWAELQLGDRKNARIHLEAALERKPDSAEAAQLLAVLNRQEGR
jgi:hypothetical protein